MPLLRTTQAIGVVLAFVTAVLAVAGLWYYTAGVWAVYMTALVLLGRESRRRVRRLYGSATSPRVFDLTVSMGRSMGRWALVSVGMLILSTIVLLVLAFFAR
jgi:hypothetical protein